MNHMIDGDDGSSCASPYHDNITCTKCNPPKAERRRFVATIEVYVYAESDEQAWQEAEVLAKELRDQHDNQASITEVVEQPFESMDNSSTTKP